MKVKFLYKYIIVFLLFSLSATCYAQIPSEATPVVPIPLDYPETAKKDSVNIEELRAKYDSIVAYLNEVYLQDNITNHHSGKASINVHDSTQKTDNTIHLEESVYKKSPDTAESKTKQYDTTGLFAREQALGLNLNDSGNFIVKLSTISISTAGINNLNHLSSLLYNTPLDTPRFKSPLDSIRGDTMLLDQIGTEEQLVDTTAVDSPGETDEVDDAEDEGEAEGEFDNTFTGYSDVSYWDLLRDPAFKFDPQMIPANHHYPFDWDTVVINPYKVSLKEMNDTILLRLKDSMDCAFHPPAIGDITSTFGFRNWGRRAKFHYGVDVRMEVGDPVYAIFDGVVRVAKKSLDYGYVVLIRHYNGLETLYAHFDQLLAYPGKPVRSGEIIGLSGNTGRSTGPHLHFEVRFKGEKIDPNKIISFPTGSLLSDTLQVDKACFSHLYKVQQTKLRARYHVVRRGDTLGKIAYKNGVSVKQIARLNRISVKTKLKVGRKLRIR